VGVYADVRSSGLSTAPTPEIVLPVAQGAAWAPWIRNLTLVVDTDMPSAAAITTLRHAVASVDAFVPVDAPTTLETVVHDAGARERFLATLLTVFGMLAIIIASVGVFGLVSFTVARQTRELAIRSALGASRTNAVRRVIGDNAALAGIGASGGALIGLLVAPMIAGFLYEVPPRDTAVFVLVPLLLTIVAVAACRAPALRVTRIPVTQALQSPD
jgi:ABC-type antimicrobial peptide transport system permease subunit